MTQTDKADRHSEEGSRQMMPVMPRVYFVVFWGIALILASFLTWAFLGTVSKTLNVSAIYHPIEGQPGEVLALVPIRTGKPLEAGMRANVFLTGYDYQQVGHMEAVIEKIDENVSTVTEMREYLPDDTLISPFMQNGPVISVWLKLREDPMSSNGYYWSSEPGKSLTLHDLTFASLTIVTESVRPITLGFPQLVSFLGV